MRALHRKNGSRLIFEEALIGAPEELRQHENAIGQKISAGESIVWDMGGESLMVTTGLKNSLFIDLFISKQAHAVRRAWPAILEYAHFIETKRIMCEPLSISRARLFTRLGFKQSDSDRVLTYHLTKNTESS